MQQKINWTPFLIFGISILSMVNCKTKNDYIIKTKVIYVNETNYKISYSGKNGDIWYPESNLNPNDSIIIKDVIDGGDKNTDPKEITFNRLGPEIVIYNGILCDTLDLNEGPNNINNYSIKTIKNNDFEYRYVFTKAFAANADTCR